MHFNGTINGTINGFFVAVPKEIHLAIDSNDQMLNGCKHFVTIYRYSNPTQISLLFGNFEEEANEQNNK
jgi:hypothetical protein